MNQSGYISPQKCICGENNFHCCHIYHKRPKGETDFKIDRYYREIWQCNSCGHFLSKTNISLEELYSGDYASMTYGNIDDIRNNFHRIMALDPNCSDNIGRVSNLKEFASNYFEKKEKISILDIGSGLGVFLAQIKLQTGWNCKAVEPDPQMAEHISGHLKIRTYNDDFRNIDFDAKFDIITLNKVLEHIENPSYLLESCKNYLERGAFLYLEVPDGECAAQDFLGFGREEFFLEHHHAFSLSSTRKMVEKAGFELIEIERLKEPSTKYTIRAFIRS